MQKIAQALAVTLLLAGCAPSPAPQVKLLPDVSCRLPVVTWSPDDSPETVTEIRRLAAARARMCKR
jgi:PBP1b-binding outer membrane lipoprotein LpoB